MSELIYKQDAKDAVDMALDTIDHVPEWVYDKLLTALDKVPSAQLGRASCKQVTGKLDLINRQDAIDALNACCVKYDISPNYDDKRTDKEKFYDWWDMHKVLSVRIINDLPSAEKAQLSGEDATFDCISRQAAIDAFWKLDVELRPSVIDAVWDMLKSLPSAEPRKKGKWLLIDAGYYDYVKCSQCGETLIWGKNFCPNCGADMREGDSE